MKKMFTKIAAGILSAAMLCGIGFVSAKVAKENAVQVKAATETIEANYNDSNWSSSTYTSKTGYYLFHNGGTFTYNGSTSLFKGVPTNESISFKVYGGTFGGDSYNRYTISLLDSSKNAIVSANGTVTGSKQTGENSVTLSLSALTNSQRTSIYGVQFKSNSGSPTNTGVRFSKLSFSYDYSSDPQLQLSKSKETIRVNGGELATSTISASVDGTQVTTGLSFVSSDASIASVNSSGVVTAVKPGEATITVSATGYSSNSISISVLPDNNTNPLNLDFSKAYYLEYNNSEAVSYLTGAIEDGYLVTSTAISDAALFSFETFDDGYAIRFGENYLNAIKDSSITFSFTSTKTKFLWNDAYSTFKIVFDGENYFMNAHGTFTTIGCSQWDRYVYSETTYPVTFELSATLESISASVADSDKVWTVGETISNSDFIVTGTYSNNVESTLPTSSYTISKTELVKGENEIVVTHIESGFTASVTINAVEAILYKKVTSALPDYSGRYLIVYEAGAKAFDGSAGTDSVNNYKNVTVSNDCISIQPSDDNFYFTIEAISVADGTYKIKNFNNSYIGRSGTSNGLNYFDTFNETNCLNKITFTSNAVSIAKGSLTLRYNNSSDQNRFRYFTSGQQPIALYKLTDENIVVEELEFNKVTSLDSLVDGKYALAGKDSSEWVFANNGISSSLSKIDTETSASESKVISKTSSVEFELSFKIENGKKYVAIKSGETYLSASSGSTGLSKSQTAVYWLITKGNSTGTFKLQVSESSTRGLLYRNTGVFDNYALSNSTASGYSEISLFAKKLDDASTFAQHFLDTMTCDGIGSITTTNPTTKWAELATEYDQLSNEAKTELTSASPNQEGSLIEKCIARYTIIVSRYPTIYNNFMELDIKISNAPIIKSLMDDQSGITTVVTVTAIASITLVGGFTLTRKRKHF